MKKVICLILLVLIGGYNVYSQCFPGSQTTFQKSFSGPYEANSVIQTSSGDYIVIGTVFNVNQSDLFILKTDSLGNEIWSKSYGGTNSEGSHRVFVTETKDGGYVLLSYTSSFGVSTNVPLIIKLNSFGGILWEKRIQSANEAFSHNGNILETSSGDLMFCWNGTVNSNYAYSIVRLDSLGNLLWSNIYENSTQEDYEPTLMMINDNNFMLTGYSYIASHAHGSVLKVDSLGTLISNNRYSHNDELRLESSLSIGNGTILMLGKVFSAGNPVVIVSTNLLGTVNWVKTYSLPNYYLGPIDMIKRNDGTVSIALTKFDHPLNKLAILNIDTMGNLLPSRSYGLSNTWLDYSFSSAPICSTKDGGLVSVSKMPANNPDDRRVFMMKLNECNRNYCNDSLLNFNTSNITIGVSTPPLVTTSENNFVSVNNSSFQITFPDTIYCMDTIDYVFQCDVEANFTSSQYCKGDSVEFTDLSIDNVGTIISWKWYFGDGDSIVGVQSPSHLYSTSGNYNVTLQVITDSNCVDSVTLPITINPVYLLNYSHSICQGDSLLLGGDYQTIAGLYTDSLQTTFGCDSLIITNLSITNNYNDSISQTICEGDSILLEGIYQTVAGVYLDSVQSAIGCDSIVTTILNVNIKPVIDVSNDTSITACSSVQLNVSGATTYTWSPNTGLSCVTCPKPLAYPSTTITYTVTGDVNGCSTKKTIEVLVDGGSELIIPNVFTPNRDGVNDGFNITGGCLFSVDKKIYNRWGELIFQSSLINEAWDGRTTSGKEVPEGTYFYIFDLEILSDGVAKQETVKGTVSLFR